MSTLLAKVHRERSRTKRREGDPWLRKLETLRGHVGYDGIERVATRSIYDLLGVPSKKRRHANTKLCKLMNGLGWSPCRVRGLMSEQIRGYSRTARHAISKPLSSEAFPLVKAPREIPFAAAA